MKRALLLLTAACLAICLLLCSCSSGSAEPTYDGEMTAVTDENGVVTGYERRYHNDAGSVTRLDSYDADKVYQSFVLYEYYDESGLLYTETLYKANGIAQLRYVYTYNEDGGLVEKAEEHTDGSALVTRFDGNGNETERISYDSDGNPIGE